MVVNEGYTPAEQQTLLRLARLTLEEITAYRPPPDVALDALPPALRKPRACFVTLRLRADNGLRGCTGTLTAQRPLAQEVVLTTAQTALSDPRFPPVLAAELPAIQVEISVLTPSQPLVFDNPADLITRLTPGLDGVTLYVHGRRATFLPQVWDAYPDPKVFLSLLCQKMGLPPDAWKSPGARVETYRAIILAELA